nr:MAG TPA: hypothetical protein [Caudoviricetes sp.]
MRILCRFAGRAQAQIDDIDAIVTLLKNVYHNHITLCLTDLC